MLPASFLQQFYKQYAPSKVDSCEQMLMSYRGRFKQMHDLLLEKYGDAPLELLHDDQGPSMLLATKRATHTLLLPLCLPALPCALPADPQHDVTQQVAPRGCVQHFAVCVFVAYFLARMYFMWQARSSGSSGGWP